MKKGISGLFSRLFGGLVGKSAFPFNRVGGSGGDAVAESLRRPYAQSPWVMRAVKIVSGPIAAVPLQFSVERRRSQNVLQPTELSQFWDSPWEGMSRSEGVEATVAWLKLKGNAFWIKDDSWLIPFKKRSPLIVARPDRIRPMQSGDTLQFWIWTDAEGHRHNLLPEQVVHLKFWNPYDERMGLAEMDSAQLAAESDYLAASFNRNLMRNNGDQGVYISAKGGMPTDEQREQIIRQLREKREMAARGIFKPMFITGDISIEDPKVATPDAAFAQNRIQNRHEVAIAFGVPPSMFDIVASYSVGSASDRFRLIEDTCMPLAEKIADAIENVSRGLLRNGSRIFAWFNWDEHSVMQQVRRERIDSATKLWDRGVPWQIINQYMDLGLPTFEGSDTGYISFGLAPVGQALDPANDPAHAEIDPVAAMMRALKSGCACHGKTATDPRRLSLWKQHMAKRAETVGAFKSRFRRELMQARAEVLSKLDRLAARGVESRASAADFLFNLASWKSGLLSAMRGVAEKGLKTAGDQLYQEIGKDDPFTMPPARALQFIRGRENRLAGVADDVFSNIQKELEAGLQAGETMGALSDRVRGAFNDIGRGRADTIAMTETSAAYGFARDEAMKSAGVKYKQWLTSGNANVREEHLAADKQIVPIDEPFLVGGEELMFPGDTKGSPENVINCHCVSIAINEEEV